MSDGTSSRPPSALGINDIAEIVVGSCVLGFPVAVTEEVWNLGVSLSLWGVAAISLASLVVIGGFVYYFYHRDERSLERKYFIRRVIAVYLITLLVCASLLTVIGKGPWVADTLVALKRTLLVAFPASFSATIVDSLK